MKFIPQLHFESPEKKLKAEWCKQVIDFYYYNGSNVNLLGDKNIKEIQDFATGDFPMTPFKKMYKSLRKKMKDRQSSNYLGSDEDENDFGLGFTPLPLIPTKLNSAVSVIHKIPIEVNCKAIDPLAAKKKEEDLKFLKNKKALEADLQPLADQMNLGKVDLGTTKHSAVKYSDSPYGLDLTDPEELDVFVNLLYSLSVETAFETVLEEFYSINNAAQTKLLETRDQFYYGVSVNKAYRSPVTGLPEIEHIHPANVWTPKSDLPDYSDNTHRYITHRVTPMELFNLFPENIKDMKHLEEIINDKQSGYCCRNGSGYVDEKQWNTYKVTVVEFEIKSVDYIGVSENKKGTKTLDSNGKRKLWAQNTYRFWWLLNTQSFFGMERLDYTHRAKGREAMQGFSTNIYKSQEKSAVELSVGENKKAQVAEIKLLHALHKALPPGKYINLYHMRNALEGLKKENSNWDIQDLILLAVEHNTHIGDTQGMDGKNDGQFEVVRQIPGGLGNEVRGYVEIIDKAKANISEYTGINEQLTGQSANPEGLVGMQKLLINSGLNALYYANEAMTNQYQKVFSIWGSTVKAAIEEGGKAKQAIIDLIGNKKANLIDGLKEVPLHTLGIKISLEQREEERQNFRYRVQRLVEKGILNSADEAILDTIKNPKDKLILLGVKEKQALKRMTQERQEAMAHQSQLVEQQSAGRLQAVDAQKQGDIEKIYAKGDVESKIIQLSKQLGLNEKQMDGMIKKMLQDDRGRSQLEKSILTLQEQANLDQQKAII